MIYGFESRKRNRFEYDIVGRYIWKGWDSVRIEVWFLRRALVVVVVVVVQKKRKRKRGVMCK